jgi:hypothetical protein
VFWVMNYIPEEKFETYAEFVKQAVLAMLRERKAATFGPDTQSLPPAIGINTWLDRLDEHINKAEKFRDHSP